MELPKQLYVELQEGDADEPPCPIAYLELDEIDNGTTIGVYKLIRTRVVRTKTTLKMK